MTEHTLVTPITTHQGQVSKLTLKRPKARTFIQHGDPFIIERGIDIDGNTVSYKVITDPKAMRGFIADMTGLDPIDLEDLDAHDFRQLMQKVQEAVNAPPTPAT